jgi:hypothetical protein
MGCFSKISDPLWIHSQENFAINAYCEKLFHFCIFLSLDFLCFRCKTVAHKEFDTNSFYPTYGTSIKLSWILISLMQVGESIPWVPSCVSRNTHLAPPTEGHKKPKTVWTGSNKSFCTRFSSDTSIVEITGLSFLSLCVCMCVRVKLLDIIFTSNISGVNTFALC